MSSSTSERGHEQRPAEQTAALPPVRDGRGRSSAPRRPKARRARLLLSRVDPWSVMKLSFLLSLATAVVTLVAVGVLWIVLDRMGVFESVSSTIESVTRERDDSEGFAIESYVGFGRIMTIAALLAAVNVVLMTALATLGAFLYNLAASLVGGLNLTFSEDV